MNTKTILLTGANGFLGSHLLEAFLKANYKMVVLKRSTSNLWRISHLMNQFESYNLDEQPIKKAFEEQQIDYVVHTACHYGRNRSPISEVVETNLLFGLRLLETSIRFNTDTFFNTDTLLQKHLNVYSLSKKQFMEWLKQQANKIKIVNLKLEHMYGPKDDTTKFIPWVLSQLKQNVDEIKLTAGEQKRDFIYVEDVVSAYLTAIDNADSLGQFNEYDVGTGNLVTVKSFIIQLKQVYETALGVKVCTHLNFGAIPYREGEMMSVNVNNHALINLGWKPVYYFQKGILELIKVQRY